MMSKMFICSSISFITYTYVYLYLIRTSYYTVVWISKESQIYNNYIKITYKVINRDGDEDEDEECTNSSSNKNNE